MSPTQIDGVSISFSDTGSADPAIVFVHGWCCDRSHFSPQIEHFGTTNRVVGVDLRGHGESEVVDGEYPIARFADDVAALISHLGLDRPVVVGHSMGGAIAYAVAQRHPAAVRGVVGVDPALFFDDGLLELVRSGAEMMAADESGEVARGLVEGSLFLETDDPELKASVVAGMMAMPRHVMVSAFQQLAAIDPAPLVEACVVPSMIIWADRSDMDLEALPGRFPDVDFRQTLGVGHFNQLLAPDEVNRHLADFLAAL